LESATNLCVNGRVKVLKIIGPVEPDPRFSPSIFVIPPRNWDAERISAGEEKAARLLFPHSFS
jgi:hypothetical protein